MFMTKPPWFGLKHRLKNGCNNPGRDVGNSPTPLCGPRYGPMAWLHSCSHLPWDHVLAHDGGMGHCFPFHGIAFTCLVMPFHAMPCLAMWCHSIPCISFPFHAMCFLTLAYLSKPCLSLEFYAIPFLGHNFLLKCMNALKHTPTI